MSSKHFLITSLVLNLVLIAGISRLSVDGGSDERAASGARDHTVAHGKAADVSKTLPELVEPQADAPAPRPLPNFAATTARQTSGLPLSAAAPYVPTPGVSAERSNFPQQHATPRTQIADSTRGPAASPTTALGRNLQPDTSATTLAVAGSLPETPGNSFSANGHRVHVEPASPDANGEASGVDLVMKPASSEPAAENRGGRYFQRFGGLTYEEQAFRAKWGWAAFDQAQRLAKQFDQ